MATMTDAAKAKVTGADVPADGPAPLRRSGTSHVNHNSNGFSAPKPLAQIRIPYAKKKYRHVAAAHREAHPSWLSHDSDASPSFLGFRNLMIIVLGKSRRVCQVVLGNLHHISCWKLAIDD
jgi:diacylglycerol O-acyltransferase-1